MSMRRWIGGGIRGLLRVLKTYAGMGKREMDIAGVGYTDSLRLLEDVEIHVVHCP